MNINYCGSSPCLYNATCINLSTGFKCLCQPNTNGTRCENSFTLNNATCVCPPGTIANLFKYFLKYQF